MSFANLPTAAAALESRVAGLQGGSGGGLTTHTPPRTFRP
jgi:hypothetical protein